MYETEALPTWFSILQSYVDGYPAIDHVRAYFSFDDDLKHIVKVYPYSIETEQLYRLVEASRALRISVSLTGDSAYGNGTLDMTLYSPASVVLDRVVYMYLVNTGRLNSDNLKKLLTVGNIPSVGKMLKKFNNVLHSYKRMLGDSMSHYADFGLGCVVANFVSDTEDILYMFKLEPQVRIEDGVASVDTFVANITVYTVEDGELVFGGEEMSFVSPENVSVQYDDEERVVRIRYAELEPIYNELVRDPSEITIDLNTGEVR